MLKSYIPSSNPLIMFSVLLLEMETWWWESLSPFLCLKPKWNWNGWISSKRLNDWKLWLKLWFSPQTLSLNTCTFENVDRHLKTSQMGYARMWEPWCKDLEFKLYLHRAQGLESCIRTKSWKANYFISKSQTYINSNQHLNFI